MDDTQHRREVFAWYGAAAHNAQCLEIELTNVLLVAARYGMPGITEDVMGNLDEFLSEKTMGRLIGFLKQKISIGGDLPVRLETALRNRNYLMHRFFLDHASDWVTSQSRETMIQELKELASDFEEVDLLLQAVTRVFFKMLGISEEQLERLIATEMQRMGGTQAV